MVNISEKVEIKILWLALQVVGLGDKVSIRVVGTRNRLNIMIKSASLSADWNPETTYLDKLLNPQFFFLRNLILL